MAITLSVPKRKTFPLQPRSAVVAALMQTCVFILAVNWCLQGMRGMDRKELAFRLGAEALLASSFLALSAPALPLWAALVTAVTAAHTVNFTFNGQVWVCARYCRWYRRDPAALNAFLRRAANGMRTLPWLREVVCIGSLGRTGTVCGDRADLDLRLVFPPGNTAWLQVNLLLLRLRTWAFLARIPLDLYAYDRPERLRRFDQREPLLVLLDRDGQLAQLYPRRVTPWP